MSSKKTKAQGSTASAPRRGRRPGDQETEEIILAAARQEFSLNGYQKTTIRSIAKAANVDPKLIHYYFGAKPELFTTAISTALDAQSLINSIQGAMNSGNTSSLGETLVTGVLTRVETAPEGIAFQGILRNLGNHEESRQVLLGFVRNTIFANILPALPSDQPERRLGLAISQLFGLIFSRTILQLAPLVDLSIPEAATIVGPTIDRYLFGELD